jgi:hypothetical protein
MQMNIKNINHFWFRPFTIIGLLFLLGTGLARANTVSYTLIEKISFVDGLATTFVKLGDFAFITVAYDDASKTTGVFGATAHYPATSLEVRFGSFVQRYVNDPPDPHFPTRIAEVNVSDGLTLAGQYIDALTHYGSEPHQSFFSLSLYDLSASAISGSSLPHLAPVLGNYNLGPAHSVCGASACLSDHDFEFHFLDSAGIGYSGSISGSTVPFASSVPEAGTALLMIFGVPVIAFLRSRRSKRIGATVKVRH